MKWREALFQAIFELGNIRKVFILPHTTEQDLISPRSWRVRGLKQCDWLGAQPS